MSSIVNKVKDALQSDKNAETQHNTTTSTHPHGTTGTTEPRVNTTSHHAPHAPQDGTYAAGDNYTRGTTGPAGGLNTGRAPTTAGPHSSNLANKVDPRVDSDLSGSNTQPITHEAYGNNKPGGIAGTAGGLSTGPASGTAGPHSSNLVNKADPRIDSDLDGRNTRTTHGTTHGNTHTLGTSGAGGSTGAAYGTTGHGNTTAGPHSSNLANKADPRVDSDFDGRNTMGSTTHGTHGTTHSTTHGTHGTAAPLAGAGAAGVAGAGAYSAHTGPASNTAGPHSSNLANKVDPRVDSDLDGSKQLGSNNNNNNNTNTTTHNPAYGTTQGTTHGTHGTQGTHGTHGSGIPLAGAGATGPGATMGSTTHGTTHGTTGTGNASGYNYNNTAGSTNAGPHSSNLANKVDPRVDSDRDGRTAAGSNTHGTHGTTHGTSHGTHGAGAPLAAGAGTAGVAGAGTHAIGGNHGVAGTHGTHGANTGIAGTQGTHSNTTGHHSAAGTGPAPNTAGPHKSDLLNKLDPRVDSNLDGSKTVGGNKTHQS